MDVLSEDNGAAFIYSNKIFNIFLKKYVFKTPPKNEEECENILENAYKIKKEINDDELEIKKEKLEQKEERNESERENKNDEEIKEKKDEDNNNEIKNKPIVINEIKYKEDLFLKKYNEIINTKGNEKIKEMIDEIVQQVFGFYFNGYFMSYLDSIDNTNNYKDLDYTKIFDNNKLFFKICIDFLEKIEKPFKGKEISIFLANAFIQSFLYVFIKYFYKNISDKEYIGKYDIGNIFQIIKGKSKFRRVVQIYVFRLIYYNIKNFKKFKEFEVKNEHYQSFVEQFLEKYSFEDPPFKLIFYCKKIFEDFINNDNECLPINYKLSGYECDNMFPYDNNIINVKMINNNEISSTSINCYENNSQFLSRLAILIVSNASKDLIDDQEQFDEINDEIKNIFKKNNKSFNSIFNEAMFELIGNLHLNLINQFHKILSQISDNDTIIDKDKEEMEEEKENYIPKINFKNFISDNNETNKYNQRVLGIFLYSLKISLTTFIFDEREKYFYSYLIMTENTSKDILDILDNSYIPGYDLDKKGLKEQKKNKDYYCSRWDTSISSLTLRFILFSNLFFTILTNKLNENDINSYSINGNYSCLRMIVCVWNCLEKKLIDNGQPIIEIYFNLIIKYLPYILKKCTLEAIKSREKTRDFVEEFRKYINKCLDNYEEYSLNFIDTKMRFIIQELNNPLKYDFNEFPLLTYYTLQSKPNRDDIIDKIDNDNNFLILNNFFNSKNPNSINFKNINLFNLGKYFVKSINDGLVLVVKQIKKYEKLFELFKSQYELSGAFGNFEDPIESININNWLVSLDSLEERIRESINNINKIIEGLLNDKIKYNSSYKYLFNEIYEEKEYLKPFDFEIINLNLSEISKYEHYAYLLINYIYRNNFKSNQSIDYFNYKKFSINSTELDENLFSILLFNKKVLLDVDYSKKFFIQKYDIFNKITNNQCFLSNYLFKYPTREELTIEQIFWI